MPAWVVLPEEAALFGMPFPAFLEWIETDAGQWWRPRMAIYWQIKNAAERRKWAERDAGQDDARWQGWRGGNCDPEEFSVFDDGASEAAA